MFQMCGWGYWSKQTEIVRSVFENKRTTVKACHGPGKALTLDTVIPTSSGKTTMGQIKPGEKLYDENGNICQVVAQTEIHERECYQIEFDDGSKIKCSDNHLWNVLLADEKHRQRARSKYCNRKKITDWRNSWDKTVTMKTSELLSKPLKTKNSGRRYSIPTCSAIEGKKIDIPAYTFGLWLGDGTAIQSAITMDPKDIFHLKPFIEAEGIVLKKRKHKYSYGLCGGSFISFLRSFNLIGNKHIPQEILRADKETRKKVLMGIVDSDGHACGKGEYEIMMVDKGLMDDIYDLICGLGYKAFMNKKKVSLNGEKRPDGYRIRFSPQEQVSLLPRRQVVFSENQSSRKTIRLIKNISPIGRQKVKCIQVSSESGLFLCGKQMIPTHNSYVVARIIISFLYYYALQGKTAKAITTAPTFRQVEKVVWKEVRAAINKSKIPLGGHLTKVEYKISDDIFAFGFSPDNPDAAQGIHDENLLIVIDEASGVPNIIHEAMNAMLTSENNHEIMIGNPTQANGYFFESFSSPLWNKISISAFETPNFTYNKIKTPQQLADMTQEEVMKLPLPAPYLTTPMWVWERVIEWGIDSIPFQSRVMALFPTEGDDVLIPFSLCEKSLEYEIKNKSKTSTKAIGIDVARYGSDTTTLTCVDSEEVLDVTWHSGKSLMKTVAKAVKMFKAMGMSKKTDCFVVDDTGLGGGVTDRLLELGYNVVAVNFGAKKLCASFTSEINPKNDKAVIFWFLQDKIKNGNFKIIDKGKLLAQLPTVRYNITTSDQFEILSKDAMKKEGLTSPDFADSLALACWGTRQSSTSNINQLLRGPSIMGNMGLQTF
jgi:phage terminase large subunit